MVKKVISINKDKNQRRFNGKIQSVPSYTSIPKAERIRGIKSTLFQIHIQLRLSIINCSIQTPIIVHAVRRMNTLLHILQTTLFLLKVLN